MMALMAVVLCATPVTLDEVRQKSRQNLDALKAELAVASAHEGWRQARAVILPQVTLSALVGASVSGPTRSFQADADGVTRLTQAPVDLPGTSRGNFSLSLAVNQLLYDGGKYWNQLKQSSAMETAASEQLEEQRSVSEYEGVRRFYELVRAQVTLRVLNAASVRSQNVLDRAKALYDAGKANKRDVLDAEVNHGNDHIAALRQRQAIGAARASLGQWIRSDQIDLEAVEPPAGMRAAPGSAEALLLQARKSRPLLRALRAQAEASARAADVAWGPFLPRVSANATYARASPSVDPFFTDWAKQHSISGSVSLSWDLFSGFATDAAVQRARIDQRNAEEAARQADLELAQELTKLKESLDLLAEIDTLARTNMGRAREALELGTARFAQGAGTTLDVRDAELKQTQAELQAEQARFDVAVGMEALRRVVGGDVEATK